MCGESVIDAEGRPRYMAARFTREEDGRPREILSKAIVTTIVRWARVSTMRQPADSAMSGTARRLDRSALTQAARQLRAVMASTVVGQLGLPTCGHHTPGARRDQGICDLSHS